MTGNHRGAVQDADLLGAGHHREQAQDMGVGYRVVVQIEAHIGGLADLDLLALLGRKGVRWQG
jgi:hypothetical protein